jgi:hypothetical protein
MIVALGPVLTLVAMLRLAGTQWLDPSLVSWASLGVVVLWCPFFSASASASVLSVWRDAACCGEVGVRRAVLLPGAMLRSPARNASLLNFASWCFTVAMCGVLFATQA